MKKFFYFLCVCAFIATSCSQDYTNEEMVTYTNYGEPKFYASFNDADSRTLLNEQMKNTWCTDDRISIFMGNTYNHHYKFDGVTGDTKGTFSKIDDPFITGEILSANYAIYPYSNENSIDDNGIIYTSLPAVQNYETKSFGLNANTMVAVTENLENRFLYFQNVCGYVRVKLYGADVTLKSVTLAGNNDEILAGSAQISAGYNQEPELSITGKSDKVLTINCGEGVKIGATEYDATEFVFVVPPQVMTKGFTVVATDTNGNTFTKTSDKSQEIKRNTILSMPELKWTDDNAPKLEIPEGILTIHNDEKGMLLVALMDYAYDEIVSLKITGTMNDEDFLWVYYEMPALRYLDISDVDITTFPTRSFYQSSNVETIIMPKTLQVIPNEVFYESAVKEVYLNEGLQTIGDSAFNNCDNLTSIHLPQSLTTMGERAFYDCNNLKEITFEDGCKLSVINPLTFYKTPIVSIQIPANIEYINHGSNSSPFYYCEMLKAVSFEDNSKLKTIRRYTFGYYANNSVLETIEIPNSVAVIEDYAFYNTNTLKNVYFEPNSSLRSINKYAFYKCGIQTIQIPASTQLIYSGAFTSCINLESVIFEDGSQLTDLGIGIDNLKYYAKTLSNEGGVFALCTNLKSVTIPSSVTTIHARAFYGCTSLSNVEFANNSQLQVIDGGWGEDNRYGRYIGSNGAFGECDKLNSITIPKSVTTIGCGAFCDSGLTNVTFEDESKLEELQGYVYYSGDSENIQYNEDISLGNDELNSIGAFTGTNISTITLPASLKNIGNGVFAKCKSLKKVTFENNSQLLSIGMKAFKDCNLSTIKIPYNLTIIGESAFANNANLKVINFEENAQLTKIENRAFINCGTINYFYAQNVTNLKRIGKKAFEGCDDMRLFKLGTAVCPTAYEGSLSSSFGEIGTYSVLKVPTQSVDAYKSATGWRKFASITGLDE